MSAERRTIPKVRRPRWEHTSDVRSERKVVSDGVEHLTLKHGRLLLPQRGGLPLLRLMDQAYDTPNAIGLEIMIGEGDPRHSQGR